MAIPVKLVTREGALVSEHEIPEFKKLPEILIWGTRTFEYRGPNLSGDDSHAVESLTGPIFYAEVFAYMIPGI